MSTTQKDSARDRLLQAILRRSASDPTFRKGLLKDPRHTIDYAFGVTIPDQVRIRFIEKDEDLDALVVLPDLRSSNGELSDGDLEAVQGGTEDPNVGIDSPW